MLVRSCGSGSDGCATDQFESESVSNSIGLGEVAGGPNLGLDQRRRNRQGWEIYLGWRAMWRQLLPGFHARPDHALRRARQADQEFWWRLADRASWHLRRPRRKYLGYRLRVYRR